MSFLPVDTLRGKTVAGEAKCRRNRTKTFDKLQNVQALTEELDWQIDEQNH